MAPDSLMMPPTGRASRKATMAETSLRPRPRCHCLLLTTLLLLPSATHALSAGLARPLPGRAAAAATLRSRQPRCTAQPVTDVAPEEEPPPGSAAASRGPIWPLNVLWRFTRPHTLIGSALCIPSLLIYAVPPGAALLGPELLGSLGSAAAFALLPSLLMNVYIVGLNQLYDVELDRINKPTLPLAAGDMTPAVGTAVVLACLLGGLALGWAHPRYCTDALRATLIGSAALGTAYSLPPMRLKRFPLLAGLTIMAVRGALVNWGFFWHGAAAAASFPVVAAPHELLAVAPLLRLQRWRCVAPVAFFTLFGTVIALVKDVPDVRGDEINGIRSFSVRLGQARVLRFGVRLLCATLAAAAAACGVAAAQSATAAACARRAAVGLLALGAARKVRTASLSVEATDSQQVYSFYMLLWKVFYASYLCLPFTR